MTNPLPLYSMDSAPPPADVDVIILSLACDPALRAVTERGIATLRASEPANAVRFRVLVIESSKDALPFEGEGVTTIYPDEAFGYHTYMNIGLRQTQAPYVCLCNNDLVFHPGWATAILDALRDDPALMSTSPLCSLHHPTVGIHANEGIRYGYRVRSEIAGWCLFFRRSMLGTTGLLDERFRFWFADNDYARTLESHGIKHALVTTAIVDHVESRTIKTQGVVRQRLLTKKAKYDFDRKWNGMSAATHMRKLCQFYVKLAVLCIREVFGSGKAEDASAQRKSKHPSSARNH